MRRMLAALLIVLSVVPHAVEAQDATHAWLLTPGARVRISYPGSDPRVGTLVALTADTVAMQWADRTDTARFARAGMSRLAVSRGIRERDRGTGARVGFAVGAGLGVLVGVVSNKPNPQCGGSRTCDNSINGLATAIGATLAGGVGALMGAVTARTTEKWEDVRLAQPRLNLVAPGKGHGTGVGMTMSF